MLIYEGLLLEDYDDDQFLVDQGIVTEVRVMWEGQETASVQIAIEWNNKGRKRYSFSKLNDMLNGKWWREASQ